jgi:hypothetical protein
MKALDFVKHKETGITGLVTEVSRTGTASIQWLERHPDLYTSWWDSEEVQVINNLAWLLAKNLAHPMSTNPVNPY